MKFLHTGLFMPFIFLSFSVSGQEIIERIENFYDREIEFVELLSNPILNSSLRHDLRKENRYIDYKRKSEAKLPQWLVSLITRVGRRQIRDRMEPLEYELQELYPQRAKLAFVLGYRAKLMAQKYYSKQGHYLGNLDAFRHTYWNALLVKYTNLDFARLWATAREIPENNASPDMSGKMDLVNNLIGRILGFKYKHLSNRQLAKVVKQEVDTGQLFRLYSTRDDDFSPTSSDEENK